MTVTPLPYVPFDARAIRRLDIMSNPMESGWFASAMGQEPSSIAERNIAQMLAEIFPAPPESPFGVVGVPDSLSGWGYRAAARQAVTYEQYRDTQESFVNWLRTGRWTGRATSPFPSAVVLFPYLDPAVFGLTVDNLDLAVETVDSYFDFAQATLDLYRNFAHRVVGTMTQGAEASIAEAQAPAA